MIYVSHPGTLSIIIPVEKDRVGELSRYLEGAGEDSSPWMQAFERLGTIHFARWVLVPESDDGVYGPLLAFESNHDGSEDEQLRDLVTELGPEIDALLRHCEGYPQSKTPPTYGSRLAFLEQHVNSHVSPYRAHPNLEVDRIRKDIELKTKIGAFVEAERRAGRLPASPVEIHRAVKDHAFQALKDLDPTPHERELPTPAALYVRAGVLVMLLALVIAAALREALSLGELATGLAAAGALLGIVGLAFALYLAFRAFVISVEKQEEATADAVRAKVIDEPDKQMAAIFYWEDQQTQNALTHLVPVKADWRRRLILSVMLFAVRFLAATYYTQGKLGPIDSIHCARWIRIDGGKRLLFFSNYDGSWESYLGEFVDKLAYWLTAVWSNTEEFPTTRDMFHSGAADEEWFKRWTRKHQLYTHVWYSAYPNTSVQNVLANAALREGLSKNLTDKELRAWLRLL